MLSKKGKVREIPVHELQGAVAAHELASGDGSAFCSLCGSDRKLSAICHPHPRPEGEERYDQLILECFGVQVTALNSQICEACVQQLRDTCRFKNLVYAAFEKTLSERSSNNTAIDIFDYRSVVSDDQSILNDHDATKKSDIDPNRPKKPTYRQQSDSVMKRVNIACKICKHKYLMYMPAGYEDFICSRCKKNLDKKMAFCKKCNVNLPEGMISDHMALHAKASKRTRTPLYKRLSPARLVCSPVKRPPKKAYECSQCFKKYQLPKNLAEHIHSAHSESLDCICSVCGKDLKTREQLDKHMQIHTGEPLFQCEVCMRVFRNKRALQLHEMSHGKLKSVNNLKCQGNTLKVN